ncbi:hypothetical protein GobsT_17910 [Gemmata obscuriglobus]|uniref:hypothetical protein n=1 Tax=Gemmata obscuriglobus TaxID=114 RepID=UPI0011CCF403|nr:hypothetical protein [Gemmata obscuriglobus]QEG27038.1 hypothetical protein GobsT_17910 [Gemmata obscuriglobus]VTS03407.1 Uncharacterized protein OS=Escherichia coli HVH 193 (4-3331423) GN=G845_04469 PE=4 SV=1 [Gemmata obscuriglobus UQM 2246]
MSKSKANRAREQQKYMAKVRKRRREQAKNRCKIEYSDKILDFTAATLIPVAVEPGAQPLKCWKNVQRKVERDGGRAVYGWSVDEHTAPGVRRLVAHTVWESPTGERVDITPSQYNDKFLEDDRAGPGCPVGYCLRDHTLEALLTLQPLMSHERAEIENGYGTPAISA